MALTAFAPARLPVALALVSLATVISALATLRQDAERGFQDAVFGPERSAAVDAMLASLGTERSAVVVYLLERAWSAILIAGALTPLATWVLGATAIAAAAKLSGATAAFAPLFSAFGYATAFALLPGDIAELALGRSAWAQLLGSLGLAALAIATWRLIGTHYRVRLARALVILTVAVVLFLVVPGAVIALAVVAVLVAAAALGLIPSPQP